MKMESKLKIVKKPWGMEVWFAHTKKYVGKFLHIRKGHRLSMQYHKKKDETVYALKGPYRLEINGKAMKIETGKSVRIAPGTVHRMSAKYGNVVIVEVSTPEVEDVVRLQDDYNRINK